MRYYISDLHFFHENLNARMDCRGFDSAGAMNEYMIKRWNGKVRKNDEVIILGDLSLGSATQTNELLARLKGRLYLIVGNHDRYLDRPEFDRERFEWIRSYEELSDNGRKVVLSHYPIICYNGQYRLDADGKPKTYMLHGHIHDSQDRRLVELFQAITRTTTFINAAGVERHIPCHLINCFCVYSDYEPLTLDEWLAVHARRG